jgi:hypothetical protein
VTLEFGKDIPATGPRLGRMRLEQHRLVVGDARVVAAVQVEQDVASAEPGRGQLRPKRQRLVIASQRIGISLEIEMNVAPSEIGLRKRGLEHQRPVIGFQGIAVSLDVEIDIPAAEPGVRQVAAQLERRVVRSERLVMPLQLAEQIATIEMRLGISDIDRERFIDIGACGLTSSEVGQNRTALGQRRHVIGLERKQRAELFQRVLQPILFRERSGSDVQQIDVAAIDLQRFEGDGRRGAKLPELAEYGYVILDELDIRRLHCQRAGHERRGFDEFAATMQREGPLQICGVVTLGHVVNARRASRRPARRH